MSNSVEIAEARRALLTKYLRGGLPPHITTHNQATAIPRRSSKDDAPLSFGQQQLWLLARLMSDAPVYTECVTIRLPGPLDVSAFKRSFHEIIQRHEAWRTSFPLQDGQPVQRIHPVQDALSLPLLDLCSLPEEGREAEALQQASLDAQRPFDLEEGPLWRALLVRLSATDHRLYLTLHHIIFDGFSIFQVLLPELHALYTAFSARRPSPLPELSIQYADFASWQRTHMPGDQLHEQLAYWKRQLAGAPTTLALPADHPRPLVPTYQGAMYRLALPKALTDGLRALSQRENVSLFMVLLAAFCTLLARLTGQDDLLIGTASGGRTHPQLQSLLGVFINTLVMRTRPLSTLPFRALLQQVRETTLEARAHQDLPFENVVRELHPDREPGQNPLFQALLMLEPPHPNFPSGWTLSLTDVDTHTSKFDLSLILEDRPTGLSGRFEYSTALFDNATIARMAGDWHTLLTGIIANPDQRLAELPMLTADEQDRLHTWNATRTPYPDNQCVQQLFEAQAARTPNAVALIFGDRLISYRDLNAQANCIAHHLRRLGVGPEVLVGICMDRSIELIAGLLGILKAGGAYVPLDPAYPRERLTFMLQDCQAPVLLIQERMRALLPPLSPEVQVLALDAATWRDAGPTEIENPPTNGATAETLAYVMYTSGSTGRPKGVAIQHRSIVRLLFGVDYVELNARQTILHMAPISFDASTFEVWGALLHGGRCVLFPDRVPTPRSIGAAIRAYGVTTLWLTASLFNAVIDEAPEALRGTQQVLTGGEALSVAHIRRALELLPEIQFSNGYGPTESTTFACCYSIPRPLPEATRSIPIGRPIGNTQVFVLDRSGHPAPIGVPGELCIGGDGLARGYLNQPALTGERFVANPFEAEPGARLYKTGDLVRFLADGTLEFLGRLDQQVKIRGFRIEPGEIEAVLKQHASVQEAQVLALEQSRGSKTLVAYVVAHTTGRDTVNELRRFFKERLPDYMLPADIMLLDALPRTPNGKLDRGALPAPDATHATPEGQQVAPTLTIHYHLIAIWEELLDMRPIGITDNFFALGGHSLLAARLVDRIEQLLHKKLTIEALFAHPTIERLASVLQREEHTTSSHSRTPIMPARLTGSRRPFFYLDGDFIGSAVYPFHLAQGLDPEQPFYVLKPYQFNGLSVPPTIQEIAAAHIEALRGIQPEGPYTLGGFCNGGIVAYEMAQQLLAQGEDIDLLALIDPGSIAPCRPIQWALDQSGRLLRVEQGRRVEWFLRIRHAVKYALLARYRHNLKVASYLETPEGQARRDQIKKVSDAYPGMDAFFPPTRALRQDWRGLYYWTIASYEPVPYPGKLTVFWSSREIARITRWAKMAQTARETETYVYDDKATGKTPEHPVVWASRLRACLDKVART